MSRSFLYLIPALIVLVIAVVYSSSISRKPASSPSACPDSALGEKAEDCPWAQVARDLQAEAAAGRPVLPKLKSELPDLYAKMESDAARGSWLALWGRSINFDEGVKDIVVYPAIVDSLLEIFHPPWGPATIVDGHQIVHAGVEHTYGYLFSNLQTSFGYKRARWVRDTLDRGFGLPEGTITPLPKEGTLFSNVTYFAGHVAFRGEPEMQILDSGATGISPSVASFHYEQLKPMRLEETVSTPAGSVVIRTDLVPFLRKVDGDTNTHLLIYSVVDHRPGPQHGSKLITVFPVADSMVDIVFQEPNLGDDKPIITRYNGYVDGITGQTQRGTRKRL